LQLTGSPGDSLQVFPVPDTDPVLRPGHHCMDASGLPDHPGRMAAPVGYEVIVVKCLRCGRKAWVAPALWDRAARRHCRKCGSADYEVRRVWRQGQPPNNVVRLMRKR
jgi:predicted nucleic-acid-binding Zn-ribbon protein